MVLFLFGAAGAGAATVAPMPAPVELSDRHQAVDVWPALSVLFDPTGRQTLDDIRIRLPERARPAVPYANFGERQGAVWLVWEMDLKPSAHGTWLLDVAFASLDEVDLHVLRGGEPLREAHQRAGDGRPLSWRAMPARTHVLPLTLAPGRYTLLLRIATTGSFVVPLHLLTPERYCVDESRVQLLQGLSTGVMLCLLMYSLTQWAVLRDRMFAYYSLCISGVTLFLFSYNGLGIQHLWGERVDVSALLSPVCVLLSAVGGFLFIGRVLDIERYSQRTSQAMHLGALIGVGSAVLLLAGLIDYRASQHIAKVLGPLPMLLALPFAWKRWRQGDRASAHVFVGWAVYAAGGITMGLLVVGRLPATGVTLHALQAGSLVEMTMWLLVMSLRVEQLRGQAEQAARDGDRLRRLADTDALTGLLNRRGLQAAAGAMLTAQRPNRLLAVYLIDLDGFKQVNDLHGHEAGDRVLVEVAARLRAQVREVDLVSRTGGDEFVLLVGDLPDDEAARRIGEGLIDALAAPMALGDVTCRIGGTAGYALGPVDGWEMVVLLQRADRAMYLGKQAGKHQVWRLAQGE